MARNRGSDSAIDGLPDPYPRPDEPSVGPAPVPVVGQTFWVDLSRPPEDVLSVEAPKGVEELDRTPRGQSADRTRIYLRSHRAIDGASVVFQTAAGGRDTVPLNVRSLREDIETQVRDVPGLDPDVRKRGRSYYTDEVLEAARANCGRPGAQSEEESDPGGGRTRFDGMSDNGLFNSLPSWNVPRSCYSNWPCPTCGESIYTKSAFYPWLRDTDRLYKLQCPRCEGWYPSNDFLADDFTGGAHPDDGWGWDPGSGDRTEFAGWIAHCAHVLWHRFGRDVEKLTGRYLLGGDEGAAHTLAVLLSRMAYVYPGMNKRWQQVDTTYLRPGRLLLDGNWERNDILVPVCRAYDAIFDRVDGDEGLVSFLQDRDPAIRSTDDVKALIETYLIQLFGWDWMRRELSGGNMGSREEDMAQFAVCADMGAVSDRWIEELFTHAYNGGANRGGFDDETLVNTVSREGVAWVCGLGYAYGYLAHKSDMAEILSRVNSPKWRHRCDLYDAGRYPKLGAEFDTWADFLVAGQFGSGYGDGGGPGGFRYPDGIPGQLRTTYSRAYSRLRSDTLARALHKAGREDSDPFDPDVWDDVDEHVRQLGPQASSRSRVMDGTGFVFLESRPEAASLDRRAGAILRYGYGCGHHHQDNLNVELFAGGRSLTPELGYPCWAHPMGDTTHVAHHITGMIDRSPQYAGPISRGDLEAFARAPEASFAEVSATPAGFPSRVYRRAICLADAPGGNVYLLDILRMAGGTKRTWCFHGPPHDSYTTDIRFGATSDEAFPLEGFGRRWENNIVDPQTAQADGDVRFDWDCLGGDVHLRTTLLGAGGREYTTARCAKPDIPPIRYLFAEDTDEDDGSEFVSIWEPYVGEPFVQGVELLDVEGEEHGEFGPLAVRVHLSGGQTDTFLYTGDPDAEVRAGGLALKGRFGYWSESGGSLRAAHLVDGKELSGAGAGLTDLPTAFPARISEVDYASRTVSLDRPVPADFDPEGELVYFRHGAHRTAYHIQGVLPDRETLKLDLNAMIYRSSLLEANGAEVTCELAPPIETSRSFAPGYYDGAILTGGDLKARYRVDRVDGDRIIVDREIDRNDFPDLDGDGRRTVCMFDMGPGDEVRIPGSDFRRV